MRLVPITADSVFPDEENLFPYMFGAGYLRLQTRQPGQAAYWAISASGAILPLIVRSIRIFRFGQIQCPPLRQGVSLSAAEEQQFLDELVAELRASKLCDRLIQPTTNCVFQVEPAGATASPFGSYRLPLAGRTVESIFATLHSNYRNEIRAAIKHHAVVRFGRDQLPAFHALHSATMRASGLHHDALGDLTELFDQLNGPTRVLCAVVYHDEQPLGGVFVPYTRHSGHYMHGGSQDDVFPPGAVRLLHWEVIRTLLREGVQEYDFVGARLSSVEGTKLEFIQRFKSRFGTTLAQGVLWKIDLRPWRSRLFDLAVKARRLVARQPLTGTGDIIDQERRKLPAVPLATTPPAAASLAPNPSRVTP